ncbi:hypothetical protein 2 [Beihai tombus-like virus 12]|uniref:hypothetical protein 2 n=1 Tax=Beihai tombus-like virus 12 TaxID=1922715 RepID=UPI00090C5D0A|nr:hypothetical protein 2 [Beihai tombus-like virus 12]APG76141.1 hypothetical protein 2 [Beihai tombus-like virus 12]
MGAAQTVVRRDYAGVDFGHAARSTAVVPIVVIIGLVSVPLLIYFRSSGRWCLGALQGLLRSARASWLGSKYHQRLVVPARIMFQDAHDGVLDVAARKLGGMIANRARFYEELDVPLLMIHEQVR